MTILSRFFMADYRFMRDFMRVMRAYVHKTAVTFSNPTFYTTLYYSLYYTLRPIAAS